jgi:hypothetical protein
MYCECVECDQKRHEKGEYCHCEKCLHQCALETEARMKEEAKQEWQKRQLASQEKQEAKRAKRKMMGDINEIKVLLIRIADKFTPL